MYYPNTVLAKLRSVWTTDDVHGIQKDFDPETEKSSLSNEQAQEVLLSVFENHDCNNGITWESLQLQQPGIFGGIV